MRIMYIIFMRMTRDTILEILEECEKAGNPDMVYKFSSTSKIQLPPDPVFRQFPLPIIT